VLFQQLQNALTIKLLCRKFILKEEKQVKNLNGYATYPGVPEIQEHTINHTQRIRRFL